MSWHWDVLTNYLGLALIGSRNHNILIPTCTKIRVIGDQNKNKVNLPAAV